MSQLEKYQIDYVHMAQIPGYVQRHVNMAYLQKYIKKFFLFLQILKLRKGMKKK